jgi:hypothetical protein
MGVSAHPVDSTVVISLWQGDVCTGTFRLPAKDAGRLVSTLAYGMAESIPRGSHDADVRSGRPPGSWSRYWSWFFNRLFARRPVQKDGPLRLLK